MSVLFIMVNSALIKDEEESFISTSLMNCEPIVSILLDDNVMDLKRLVREEGSVYKAFSEAVGYCKEKYNVNSLVLTPLHVAAVMGSKEILRYLLFELHLRDVPDAQGKLARDYANSNEVTQILDEYERFKWRNPLIIAVFRIAGAFTT